jgi:hypothetical protein
LRYGVASLAVSRPTEAETDTETEGDADLYRYDESIPCNPFVVDGTAFLGNSHPEAEQSCALIESENDAVRSWAREVIRTYRGEAEHLDTESFREQQLYRSIASSDTADIPEEVKDRYRSGISSRT